MGESPNEPFQLSFNASLKIDFQGSRVTSDGGLILVRELDERLGFGALIEQPAAAGRTPAVGRIRSFPSPIPQSGTAIRLWSPGWLRRPQSRRAGPRGSPRPRPSN